MRGPIGISYIRIDQRPDIYMQKTIIAYVALGCSIWPLLICKHRDYGEISPRGVVSMGCALLASVALFS